MGHLGLATPVRPRCYHRVLSKSGVKRSHSYTAHHPVPSTEPFRKQETLLLGPQPHFNPSPNVHALQASPQTPALRELTPTSEVLWWAKKQILHSDKPRWNPCDGGIKPRQKVFSDAASCRRPCHGRRTNSPKSWDCALCFELAFPCLELPRSSELRQSLPAMAGCGAGLATARPSSFLSPR